MPPAPATVRGGPSPMPPSEIVPNFSARRKQFFVYTTGRSASALAAGATLNTSVIIQADSDFLWEKATYSADLAGVAQNSGAQIVPNFTVLITASSSGAQIMNSAVPLSGLFGTGQLPFILPYPRVLPANSQLTIQITSFEAAQTPFITLNFIGRKIFLLEP